MNEQNLKRQVELLEKQLADQQRETDKIHRENEKYLDLLKDIQKSKDDITNLKQMMTEIYDLIQTKEKSHRETSLSHSENINTNITFRDLQRATDGSTSRQLRANTGGISPRISTPNHQSNASFEAARFSSYYSPMETSSGKYTNTDLKLETIPDTVDIQEDIGDIEPKRGYLSSIFSKRRNKSKN